MDILFPTELENPHPSVRIDSLQGYSIRGVGENIYCWMMTLAKPIKIKIRIRVRVRVTKI